MNTQYLVLFNNPIDRQQVATLARRIYPSTSVTFMKRFDEATSRPYGYLLVDIKSSTSEQDRLRTNIFESKDQQVFEPTDEENVSDVDDTSSVGSIDDIHDHGPPGESLGMSAQGLTYGIEDFKFRSGGLIYTGVIQKVLPVLSTETLLHIWLSTEYYGFRSSSTAVDTGDTRGLMMSK